ncbi:hypothetical protein LCGC14_1853480, partial [marine sediment metagenome]
MLTDDEYDSARRSVLNAHFTDPAIVIKMWEALQHMGFQGGRLLEPGMGAGYFWSLIPPELAGATRLSGVELDLITGRIAKLLFPKADVRVQGFEEFQIPDDYYAAAMSNVPFGEYRPFDPKYQKHRFTIHNYFFAKTLDKVQPGGVVAFITSRYTMDSKTGVRMRQYLAARADLLGAIRLPNTAFKKVAGTAVTTDIIFLRKRHVGEEVGGENWAELGSIDVKVEGRTQPMPLNEYFVQHPEMMLGTMEFTGTQYRKDEPTLAPKEGNLADQMAEAIEALPRDVMVPEDMGTDVDMPQTIMAPDTVKEGAFVMEGGKLMRRRSGVLIPARNAQGKAYTGVTLKRIKALIEIRDAARTVLTAQLTDETDADIHKSQADLTKVYDRFVRRFGAINQKSGARRLNLEGFRDDPDLQLVANLENIQLVDEEERFVKADLFTQRVLSPPKPIQHAEKPEDAELQLGLFDTRGRQIKGWTNKLIWGDNKLILSSLKNGPLREEIEVQGGLKLIYIDPPFNMGADFSMGIEIGGDTFTKKPNILEEIAYRDTWGKGADSFIAMIYERLVLMRDLLADEGSIFLHIGPNVSHYVNTVLDEVFG